MATTIQGYCLALGCRERVPSGYCAQHQQLHRDYRPYKRQAWRRFREQVLTERVWCEDCGRLATEVHHKVKRKDDMRVFYDESNVIAVCKPCHTRRTRHGE